MRAERLGVDRRKRLGARRDFDTVTEVVAKALTARPLPLGDRFSAADVVMGAGIRFGTLMRLLAERPELLACASRPNSRPALQRAMAQEAEVPARKPRSPGKEIW